jgi:hypothetical protein
MKQLPQISYAVGEKKMCCPKAAEALAKESNGHIHYVVADKEYHKESKAKMALVEVTEKFVADFCEPKKCSVSGTITVAGKKACCPTTAAQTAKLVKQAMDKVSMSYLVADQACHCPVEAKKLASDAGKQVEYVVGEQKTCCDVEARLNLARAKYKAAVQALAQAEAVAAAEGS